MTRRDGAAAVALVLALALALTGCAGIPDSGPVRTNDTRAVPEESPDIRVLARPPAPGASPTEIVRGFLNASANFEGDHEVARSYLTSRAARTWDAESGVTVYARPPGFEVASDGPGRVQMIAFEAAGRLDARGHFSQPATDDFRTVFGLREVEGEWRIEQLSDGLILSTGDLDRAYRPVNLYFLDATGDVLVPDPIHLPSQRPGMATALTRQLLAGPTAWLAPAVRTAIPRGTDLAVDSVPVEDGVARVDLDRSALSVTGEDRRALAAQITYTLSQLPDVKAVELTLNGVPYAVPGIRSVSTVEDWEGFDPDAPPLDDGSYAIRDGALVNLTAPVSNVSGWFGGSVGLLRAAVSASGRTIVGSVRARDGSQDVRIGGPGSAQSSVIYRGSRITGLSIDRFDSAWIADTSGSESSITVVGANTPVRRVDILGLGDRRIGAIRISRDGARIAMVLSPARGGPGLLYLGRVDRTKTTPVIAGLHRLERELTDVAAIAWADDSTLLTIGLRDSDVTQVFRVGIDGNSVEGEGTVAGMNAVAAAPGRPYLVGAEKNTLWIDGGSGWMLFTTGAGPVYPG